MRLERCVLLSLCVGLEAAAGCAAPAAPAPGASGAAEEGNVGSEQRVVAPTDVGSEQPLATVKGDAGSPTACELEPDKVVVPEDPDCLMCGMG